MQFEGEEKSSFGVRAVDDSRRGLFVAHKLLDPNANANANKPIGGDLSHETKQNHHAQPIHLSEK